MGNFRVRIRCCLTICLVVIIILLSGCIGPIGFVIETVGQQAEFLSEIQEIDGLQKIRIDNPDFNFSEAWGTVDSLSQKTKVIAIKSSIKTKLIVFFTMLAGDVLETLVDGAFYFYDPDEIEWMGHEINSTSISLQGTEVKIPTDETALVFGLVIIIKPSEVAKEIGETIESLINETYQLNNAPPGSIQKQPAPPIYQVNIFWKDSGVPIPNLDKDILVMIRPVPRKYFESDIPLGNLQILDEFYQVELLDN